MMAFKSLNGEEWGGGGGAGEAEGERILHEFYLLNITLNRRCGCAPN